MRNLLLVTALSTPLASIAAEITLDANFYWQVQVNSTYETVCEGFLDSCEVDSGLYNVINLTTGERTEGVLASDPVPGARPEIVIRNCDWTDAELQPTDPTVPDGVSSYGPLPCDVSCPMDKVIVATIECTLGTDLITSDLLTAVYLPTAFISTQTGGSCRANRDLFEEDAPVETIVKIACQ